MAAQPFDWIGYYTLATELATRADEAAHRSAISRAYYYVYHLAMARAVTNGFQIYAGEGTHQQLWRNYSGSPDPDCKKLAEIAKRLKGKREQADYEKVYPRINEEVAAVINYAQDFANRLRVLPLRFSNPAGIRQ